MRETTLMVAGLVLAGIGLTVLSIWLVYAPPVLASTFDSKCGPYSLCAALGRLGIPMEVADVVKQCRAQDGGASFGELKRVAEASGVAARLAKLSWKELSKVDGTAILYYKGGPHFVAVDPRERSPEGECIRVYDSLNVAKWVTKNQLKRLWPDGQCLVLQKLGRSGGSQNGGLEMDTTWIDVGFRRSSEKAIGVYLLKNVGRGPLAVEVVSSSCGCLKAELGRRNLSAGEETNLTVAVDLGHRRGLFTEYVVMKTTDVKMPLFRVFLRGSVLNEKVASTDVLYFGEVTCGAQMDRSFIAHDPGDGRLDIRDVQVSIDMPGIRGQGSVKKIVGPSDARSVRSRFPVRKGDYLITVHMVSPAEQSNSSTWSGVCRLFTNLSGESERCDVRLYGTITPDVQAQPPALVLSGSPISRSSKDILLRSKTGRDMDIRSVRVVGNVPLVTTHHRSGNDATWIVSVSLPDGWKNSPELVPEAQVFCETSLGNYVVPVVVLPVKGGAATTFSAGP